MASTRTLRPKGPLHRSASYRTQCLQASTPAERTSSSAARTSKTLDFEAKFGQTDNKAKGKGKGKAQPAKGKASSPIVKFDSERTDMPFLDESVLEKRRKASASKAAGARARDEQD